MQQDVLQPQWSQMMPSLVVMLVWLVLMIAILVAFFRGMRALTQIAATLERIEQRLPSRPSGD